MQAPILTNTIGQRLFVWLQHVLPQHALSRLIFALTRVRSRRIKNALIRGFLDMYRVDMTEAEHGDATIYPTFNEFFTRALKSGIRPIDAAADAIISPVDGTVSECGIIDGKRLLQAKGRWYELADLLTDSELAKRFENGCFATIYLAPFNYHRIHMPLAGQLASTTYVPGRLFSVNGVTARQVPRLFARNERVVTMFDTPAGAMGLILVGALNVGSMATVWAGDICPGAPRRVTRLPHSVLNLQKGEEMGRFNMGSTVILLFEPRRARLRHDLQAGSVVRLGERIGTVEPQR